MATVSGIYKNFLRLTQAAPAGYKGGNSLVIDEDIPIGSGTSLEKVNLISSNKNVSIGGSTNVDVDLTALLDPAGAALSGLKEVCYLEIVAHEDNGGELEIKPSAANGWVSWLKDPTDVIVLEPGASVRLKCWKAAAYTVGAANKSININNTDGSAGKYDLDLAGRDA